MRTTLIITTGLITLAFAASAFAASSEDAAYDKNQQTVIDSRGNCVRTQWEDANDPCAAKEPEAPKYVPVAMPKPAAPIVSREARTLYFDFDKAELTDTSKAKLDELAAIINDSKAIEDVAIHGFTDQMGSDSYNAALAQQRVDTAKAYLDSKARLKAEGDIKGLGKASPEVGCEAKKKRADKISCMAKERRVEIEFNASK